MFLAFLRRHFDLHVFCPQASGLRARESYSPLTGELVHTALQATNIVVFEDYFALKVGHADGGPGLCCEHPHCHFCPPRSLSDRAR